jgi:hypothetical protein
VLQHASRFQPRSVQSNQYPRYRETIVDTSR